MRWYVCGQSRRAFALALWAALGLPGVSCSSKPSLHPVQGRVTYRGQPLAGAVVSFHPEGQSDLTVEPAVGLTKEDGAFTLTTGQDTGAAAGSYIVTIICSEVVKPTGGISTAPPDSRDRLNGVYANVGTSQIKIEIKPGPNDLAPFALK